MKFCNACGFRMELTSKGYFCPNCDTSTPIDNPKKRTIQHASSKRIFVLDNPQEGTRKVDQRCSQCGNNEASYWVSQTLGEHAGIPQERTMEHFKCTKCLHTWIRTR